MKQRFLFSLIPIVAVLALTLVGCPYEPERPPDIIIREGGDAGTASGQYGSQSHLVRVIIIPEDEDPTQINEVVWIVRDTVRRWEWLVTQNDTNDTIDGLPPNGLSGDLNNTFNPPNITAGNPVPINYPRLVFRDAVLNPPAGVNPFIHFIDNANAGATRTKWALAAAGQAAAEAVEIDTGWPKVFQGANRFLPFNPGTIINNYDAGVMRVNVVVDIDGTVQRVAAINANGGGGFAGPQGALFNAVIDAGMLTTISTHGFRESDFSGVGDLGNLGGEDASGALAAFVEAGNAALQRARRAIGGPDYVAP